MEIHELCLRTYKSESQSLRIHFEEDLKVILMHSKFWALPVNKYNVSILSFSPE